MRRFLAVTYLFAIVLLAGCGSDSGTNPESNTFNRVYVLTSVNGSALPYAIAADAEDEGVVFTLTSDRITFQEDGNFVETMTVTATQGGVTSGPAVGTLNGTYTYSASTRAISLNVGAGDQFTGLTGSITDASMTLTDGSVAYVFLPQP
jgi:hypothetical protein